MAMNRITENILLGSHFALSAQKTLKREKVTHILSLVQSGVKPEHVADFEHMQINVDDIEDENIIKFFPQILEFIDRAVQQGTSILVHCMAGVSRSSTAVCAYLMHVRVWTAEQALEYVRERRSVVRPNTSFMEQLQIFYACGFEVDESKAPYRRWLLRQRAEDIAMRFTASANKLSYTSETTPHVPRSSELTFPKSRKSWRMALPPILFNVKQTRSLPEQFDLAKILAPKRQRRRKTAGDQNCGGTGLATAAATAGAGASGNHLTDSMASVTEGSGASSGGSDPEIEAEHGEHKYLCEEDDEEVCAAKNSNKTVAEENNPSVNGITSGLSGVTFVAEGDTTSEEDTDVDSTKPKLPFKLKKKPKPKDQYLILTTTNGAFEKIIDVRANPSDDLKGVEGPVLKLRLGAYDDPDRSEHVLTSGHQLLDAIYARSGSGSTTPASLSGQRTSQLRCKKCSCPLALSAAYIVHDPCKAANGKSKSGTNLAFGSHTINGHRIPSVRQNLVQLRNGRHSNDKDKDSSNTNSAATTNNTSSSTANNRPLNVATTFPSGSGGGPVSPSGSPLTNCGSPGAFGPRCMHFFVEPVAWMRPELEKGQLEGKLQCPRCSCRVGAYHWQGMKCSCGTWVTPAISLQKSRVDEVPLNPLRTNSSVL